MLRRPLVLTLVALAVFAATAVAASAGGGGGGNDHNGGNADSLSKIKHIVVIYEENHSFDNLYGGWEGVNGLANARPANTVQLAQTGLPFTCLLQLDVNLTSPPLSPLCDATDHFANAPFTIDDYIPATATTCPAAGRLRPERGRERLWPARRLHPRHRAPLLPGAVPDRQRQAGPLRAGQRRRGPRDGPLRHEEAADLRSTCTRGTIRTTRSPTTSSRERSAARSSTTSG